MSSNPIALTLICLLLMFTLSIALPTQVFAQVYPAGMISYWKLDEGSGTTAFDSVGANDGTLVNGPIWTTGIVDGALSFDGVDDYVDAGLGYPNMATLLTFTLEAWVKWEGGREQTIIAKPWGRATSGVEYGFGLGVDNGKLWGWSNRDGRWPWARTSETIPLSIWTHVTFTCRYISYREREFHFYINGVEASIEDNNVGATIYAYPKIYIGAGSTIGPRGYYFNGTIDEVAIYDRVLTAEEIQQHYQNGLNGLGYLALLSATIDVDPDTLNLRSRGRWITCYIELPEGYDVSDIDVGTVELITEKGVVSAENDPKHDFVSDPESRIGDYDNDGILDCMVKFDMSAVQEILEVGDEVEITVAGELTVGTPFEGSDTIRVIDGGNVKDHKVENPKGKGPKK